MNCKHIGSMAYNQESGNAYCQICEREWLPEPESFGEQVRAAFQQSKDNPQNWTSGLKEPEKPTPEKVKSWFGGDFGANQSNPMYADSSSYVPKDPISSSHTPPTESPITNESFCIECGFKCPHKTCPTKPYCSKETCEGCTVHPKQEYYTKDEIDKALDQCDKYSFDRITDDREDERQFRKDLLDVLEKEFLGVKKIREPNIGFTLFSDLRKRFIS